MVLPNEHDGSASPRGIESGWPCLIITKGVNRRGHNPGDARFNRYDRRACYFLERDGRSREMIYCLLDILEMQGLYARQNLDLQGRCLHDLFEGRSHPERLQLGNTCLRLVVYATSSFLGVTSIFTCSSFFVISSSKAFAATSSRLTRAVIILSAPAYLPTNGQLVST